MKPCQERSILKLYSAPATRGEQSGADTVSRQSSPNQRISRYVEPCVGSCPGADHPMASFLMSGLPGGSQITQGEAVKPVNSVSPGVPSKEGLSRHNPDP